MVESSLVLWDQRVIALSRGKPAEVEFDFDTVWRIKKNSPHVFKQRELTWLHVHPIGYGTQASSTDINCAEGLNAAFGNMGWFGILCFNDADLDWIGGQITWYRWVKGELRREIRQGRVMGKRVEEDTFEITDWFRENDYVPFMLKAVAFAKQ